MMGRLYLLLIVVWFVGCGTNPTGIDRDSLVSDSAAVDSLITAPNPFPVEAHLFDIANFIDSAGFTDDSTRMAKVYAELNNSEKLYGRGHTFYVCERSETCVGATSNMSGAQNIAAWFDSVSIGNEAVIAYFFTDAGKNDFYNDGIIEQWTFRDSATARRAAEKIIFTEMIFGHNAPPAVCYVDSKMYVFRSRSTPGMYTLLPFFREFVKRNNAKVVARESGWQ